MKFALSTIALGIGLACASQFSSAAATVTISQQGTGNTAAADQSVGPNSDGFVTITQTGNDNHVGGPGGTTGGIFQRVQSNGGVSNATQTGTGNNVGIVQDVVGTQGSTINVTQAGNANSAIVNQVNSAGTDVIVRQAGTGNATNIRQSAGDSVIQVTQNGIDNRATVFEEDTGLFFGPIIEQNGAGNTVSATAISVGFSDHDIVQTGLRNHAITNQTTPFPKDLSIRQVGADNRAGIAQAGASQTAAIDQNGNDNVASIIQGGITSFQNTALITQMGSINNATIRQIGNGFSSAVNQIGVGNYANVYQH